jgi:hypothetical protein
MWQSASEQICLQICFPFTLNSIMMSCFGREEPNLLGQKFCRCKPIPTHQIRPDQAERNKEVNEATKEMQEAWCMRQESNLQDNSKPTIILCKSSFWTTCLTQTTIDEGVGRTKKASTAFIHHKFDAQQQTGDDHIDSPAASMGKGRECTRLGEPSTRERCV